MLPVEQPFKIYTGRDGKALNNGYVYFGLPNQNPINEAQRVTVYWDAAGTQPAEQPLRTESGYIVRAGTPANVFFDGSYSTLVQDSMKSQVFYARTSDDFSIATVVLNFIASIIADTGASVIGFIQNLTGAVRRTMLEKACDEVSSKDLGVKSDGATDDRLALIAAMAACATAGRTLVIEDGISPCSDWLPIPSGLKMRFKPGAQWKLTAESSLGGFVCCGYDIALNDIACEDVEIHGLSLDCNLIPGENGFCIVNGTNIRLHSPKIVNTRFSPVKLGGRAFQYEGFIIDGVYVWNPYIEDCSIGINSQASPTGSTIARNLNYYDVVMRDVNIPFNVDSQYANPETNTLNTMSTFVNGATLYDCGRITWAGDTSAGMGGGIVCGDRGSGVSITGMRVYNSASYGGIGGIVRGVVFDIRLTDIQFYGTYVQTPFNFNQTGFGSSSAGTFPATVFTDGAISINANMDYVVAAGPSTLRIGAACMNGIQINGTVASLTGIMDANAGTATTAMLELSLSDQIYKTSGLRTLKTLFDKGNTTALCCFEHGLGETGSWTPTDGSGAGLVLTVVAGTATWFKHGKFCTAKAQITYPVTASGASAKIGGIPFAGVNLGNFAGAGVLAYKTVPTLAAAYVQGNTSNIVLTAEDGIAITNTTMSGGQIFISATWQWSI